MDLRRFGLTVARLAVLPGLGVVTAVAAGAFVVGALHDGAGAGEVSPSATVSALSLSAARSVGDSSVSVVAAIRPVPDTSLGTDDVRVTQDGTTVAVAVSPVLSARSSLSLVVDASAQAAESTTGGGLSGAASFLLQMPTGALLSVVADQDPPAVVAAPAVGPSAALDATSKLSSRGSRATADALGTALTTAQQSGRQPVVVLYTSAPDAGGVAAEDLAEQLRSAGAVLGVVTTSGAGDFWGQVARGTGGVAVRTRPEQAITAFDRLADGLTARAVLSFPRPADPDAAVQVTVRTPAGDAAQTVALPPVGAAVSAGGGAWWLLPVVLLLLVIIVAVLAATLQRRPGGRPRHGAPVIARVSEVFPEVVRAPSPPVREWEPEPQLQPELELRPQPELEMEPEPAPAPEPEPEPEPEPRLEPGPEQGREPGSGQPALDPESPLKARFEEIKAALQAPRPDDDR